MFMFHVCVSTLLTRNKFERSPKHVVISLFLMTQSWFTNILQGTRRRSVTETAERGARKITEIIREFPICKYVQYHAISPLSQRTMLRVGDRSFIFHIPILLHLRKRLGFKTSAGARMHSVCIPENNTG